MGGGKPEPRDVNRANVTFYLGPAGSGKTEHCVQSAQQRLFQSSEGFPLLFLTPRQATFQIEARILDAPYIRGFAHDRLKILSFDKLAHEILTASSPAPPSLLGDGGRIMVLQSLIDKHAKELRTFRSGFQELILTEALDEETSGFRSLPTDRDLTYAQALNELLKRLEQRRIDENRLEQLTNNLAFSESLRNKLHDLTVLYRHYQQWLRDHRLMDSGALLNEATRRLSLPAGQENAVELTLDSLWADGFADLTPQELALLHALVRRTTHTHLYFCLDQTQSENPSWLNPWQTISENYRLCRATLASIEGVDSKVEELPRHPTGSRYRASPALQHLEAHWAEPVAAEDEPDGIRIAACLNRETEVLYAARAIVRSVRERGLRYRDITVIVRSLDGYAETIESVFNRYRIPHFIDRRASIRHHPAVLLIQCALRLMVFNWRDEDWFTALKTQLLEATPEQVNQLENAALEYGIKGTDWLDPLPARIPQSPALEALRHKLLTPFERLHQALLGKKKDRRRKITGKKLADGIERFWKQIKLARSLKRWHQPKANDAARSLGSDLSLHKEVSAHLDEWLKELRFSFSESVHALHQWLGILDPSLRSLNVGVIPSTLDQVLIGQIDRTRTPEMQHAMLLGMNESVFPAQPEQLSLLVDAEQKQLQQSNVQLFPSLKRNLSNEQFLAYIACTRPQKELTITYAERDAEGKPINPSTVIDHLRHLFPKLAEERFDGDPEVAQAEHLCELTELIFHEESRELAPSLIERLNQANRHIPWIAAPSPPGTALAPEIARLLYTDETGTMPTSASSLEDFAACPFRFFLRSGLQAEERKQLRLDPAAMGSFQHEVLKRFHDTVRGRDQHWRDLPPDGARKLVAGLVEQTAAEPRYRIFQRSEAEAFSLRLIDDQLQNCVATLVHWMRQYEFDPLFVELKFGGRDNPIGPWVLPLDSAQLAFRGVIDRLDVIRHREDGPPAVIVIDYKSGKKTLDQELVYNGVQLQLFAYLNAALKAPDIAGSCQAEELEPAGVFFLPIRGRRKIWKNRDEANSDQARLERYGAYQHVGCFDLDYLPRLDNRPEQKKGDQFPYRLKKDGQPYGNSWQAMPTPTFQAWIRRNETLIRNMGQRILDGEAAVSPYREKNNSTPCQYCDYASVCRFVPETHEYRRLEPLPRKI